jgi:hypothetical protein
VKLHVASEHPLQRYWYADEDGRYPYSVGCRMSGIRCGGCRCSAPADGRRCPCCGWQSRQFRCVVCGGMASIDDAIFQTRGPAHDRRCASSAWLRNTEHGISICPSGRGTNNG